MKSSKNFNPLVSVIIPVYNGENYVQEAIDSVLNQTYKNIEIIVVNDGSKDKTEEICTKYGKKIVYHKKENGGVASALNYGIKNMNGEYFSWLSHDDIYRPNKIEKEIEVLDGLENKETIIFSEFTLIDKDGKEFNRVNYTTFFSEKEICKNVFPVIRGCVNGDTILINRKCFDKIGLFREDLHCTQDYDLWFKLFANYPSYLIKEYLVEYRVHDKQDTNSYPNVNDEGDLLWYNNIKTLNGKIIESWGQNPIEVVMFLYNQMKDAKYEKATKLTWNLAKELYSKYSPKVSIIMPCYNAENYIQDSIESILNQSYGGFELIVVDDGSTDSTNKIIRELIKKDFRIKLFKNEFSKGIVGGLNTGLKYARGEYITRQDADDISSFIRIELQTSYLKNNNKCGYVATNINFLNESGNLTRENVYASNEVPIEFQAAFGNPIPNATIMYRKQLINKYKLKFNGNINVAEDYNFLLNYISKSKTKGHFITEGLYNYRILENSSFHTNVELAIAKSKEYAKDYYKLAIDNYDEFFEKISFAEDKLEIDSFELSMALRVYIEFLIYCKENFSWTENEVTETYKYIAEKIAYGYKKNNNVNNKEIGSSLNYEKNNGKRNTRISYLLKKGREYYKLNGAKKTCKKIFNYILKK